MTFFMRTKYTKRSEKHDRENIKTMLSIPPNSHLLSYYFPKFGMLDFYHRTTYFPLENQIILDLKPTLQVQLFDIRHMYMSL